MRRSSTAESPYRRSPSLDSNSKPGSPPPTSTFRRYSSDYEYSSTPFGFGFRAAPGPGPQAAKGRYTNAQGKKYVVFYLDLSFIFLLELRHCRMAQGCMRGLRYGMVFFNLLFWLGGCGILGVGVWLSATQGNFATLSSSLPSLSAANLLITVGAIVMVIGCLGCMGAVKESRPLLLSRLWLILLVPTLSLCSYPGSYPVLVLLPWLLPCPCALTLVPTLSLCSYPGSYPVLVLLPWCLPCPCALTLAPILSLCSYPGSYPVLVLLPWCLPCPCALTLAPTLSLCSYPGAYPVLVLLPWLLPCPCALTLAPTLSLCSYPGAYPVLFFILLLLIFLLEILSIILFFSYQDQIDHYAQSDLKRGLQLFGTEGNVGLTNAWSIVQTDFRCCGVTNHTDWFEVYNATRVPDSCCLEYSDNCGLENPGTWWTAPCYERVKGWLQENLVVLWIFALCTALTQILGLVFSMTMFCQTVKAETFYA
ncbi:hypothetical protein JZ751_002699 [Albula glossodonta]|uniref:Tetraspanin-4 n=1 Tax=Albula glossodonta TaxID=121402 RepID=A0A8T2NF81_9TELE|nr:hypothetical protein JZ751_002699 [Albula glossodonta]